MSIQLSCVWMKGHLISFVNLLGNHTDQTNFINFNINIYIVLIVSPLTFVITDLR